MFQLGQIVKCVEKPGYLDGFSRGKEYVVCGIEKHNEATYIKILGDDDRGHTLLCKMFRAAE